MNKGVSVFLIILFILIGIFTLFFLIKTPLSNENTVLPDENKEKENSQNEIMPNEDYSCGEWSNCENNIHTRECRGLQKGDYAKRTEKEECFEEKLNPPEPLENNSNQIQKIQMNGIYNLEVVFYNVTTCYVAETCNAGDDCDSIKDYREPHGSIFTFKAGTLKTEKQSESSIYPLRYCIRSSFNYSDINNMESYFYEVSDFIYSWTNHGMKIIPYFRFVKVDMGSGLLNKESNSPTGYVTGKNPPVEQFEYYANLAGADFENMDMFVAVVNPFPDIESQNQGLQNQIYIGATYGEISGVPPVFIAAFPWDRGWHIASIIHELTHVVNMGHYLVSNFTDVYGIENAEARGWHPGQTWPHCFLTNHYTDGTPDRYKYFPDSYYWLDPMFNTKPFESYPQSGAFSFCAQIDDGNKLWPSVNPLDPNDYYEDFQGLPSTMKYYKFVYQAHWKDEYKNTLYTNSYKAGLPKWPLS